MSKKKMFSYVATGLVLVYILGFAVCFTGASAVIAQEFSSFRNSFTAYARANERHYTNGQDDNEIADFIRYCQQTTSRFPYFAVAYDKDGNIVAQTGTYISFVKSGEKRLYCYLDEYLTDEMKRDIADLEKKAKKTYVAVSEFEFNIDGDKVIPVKLGLKLGYGEEKLTLVFSDKEASERLDGENYLSAYITIYDMDENHYNRKMYDELREYVLSDERKQEALRNIESLGGGGFSSYNYFFYDCAGRYGDENFAIVEAGGFRPILTVLVSDYFMLFVMEFSLGFVLLAIVILVISNKLYNKNRQLENARIAFTSAAAHELKTPLAVISNLSECIIENIAPEKNGQYMNSIYAEAVRMNKLVNTLLEYNRITMAEKIEKEPCDLSAVARKELEKYSGLFEEKGISVTKDFEKADINCNTGLISLVADNFLSNALKFTPENGEVKVSVKNENGKVKLTVFNSGSHIAPDHGKHIWEEFYRIDSVRNSTDKSSGMGLAICRKILDLHGFKYGYVSKEDGVEFYFTVC